MYGGKHTVECLRLGDFKFCKEVYGYFVQLFVDCIEELCNHQLKFELAINYFLKILSSGSLGSEVVRQNMNCRTYEHRQFESILWTMECPRCTNDLLLYDLW